MKKFNIQFRTLEEVKDFVNFISTKDYDVDLSIDHYVVDAKSIMGVFSLDTSRKLNISLNCTDEEAEDFIDKFGNLLS